ncbi:MAG: hypothetical protein V7632_1321, partial [Bradyrhizobium sp.]
AERPFRNYLLMADLVPTKTKTDDCKGISWPRSSIR